MAMSDEEITRELAQKVMGWTVGDHPEKHGSGQCPNGMVHLFAAVEGASPVLLIRLATAI